MVEYVNHKLSIGAIIVIAIMLIVFEPNIWRSILNIRVLLIILGILGMWLFEKNYKIAVIQYFISAFFTTVYNLNGFYVFYLPAAALYLLAGFFAILEGDKISPDTRFITNDVESHYFENSSQNQEIQQQTVNVTSTNALLSIPILSILLSIFIWFVFI